MRWLLSLACLPAALLLAGCGSSGGSKAGTTATPQSSTPTTTPTTTSGATGSPGALQAEANATAAGDIPDNQVFLVFRNAGAGYSIKYPEGWAQLGSGGHVTFRDKNNIVRVVVAPGPRPTAARARADLAAASLAGAPMTMTIGGAPAVKASYSTESAPNSVTGKRVKLVVDRYYLWRNGRRAVVDLGTPVGVDNVDAYRLMIESFRWR